MMAKLRSDNIKKIIFLGTGPSIPVKGRGKNYRTNSSILITADGKNIIIDVTPMVEEQLFVNNIKHVDAALITHGHADAIKGLHALNELMGKIPLYASKQTFNVIHEHYKTLDYEEHILEPYKPVEIFGVTFIPIPVIHAEPFPTGSKFPTFAYRFDSILYAEDMEAIPKESEKYFKNLDLLIIDAAMYFDKKIRGHLNTEQALQIIKQYKPKKAILTQIGRTYPDHYKAQKRVDEYCKANDIISEVKLAYDGMVIESLQEAKIVKDMKESCSENERIAIYLVKPHAEMIYNNEKKLIVKSRKFSNMLNIDLYLVDDEFCYGIIKLTNIKEITLNEFEKLKDLHRITDEERKKWWPNAEKLYAYEFEYVVRFPEPKPVELPQGAQTFIKDWQFATKKLSVSYSRTIDLIENIYEYDPKNVGNDQLADDIRLAISWYSSILSGKKFKFTKDQVIDLATKILKEILRRKKAGKMKWTAKPEQGTEAYQKLWNEVKLTPEEKEFLRKEDVQLKKNENVLTQLLPEIEDHVILKDFVSIVGSTVEKGDGNDVDVLIRLKDLDYFRRAIQTLIQKKLNKLKIYKPVHAFMEAEGPHDSYIPIYDLKLVAKKPFKIVQMSEELKDKIPIPYLPQKPYGSAFNKIEDLLDKLSEDKQYFVEKKFNGFHCIVIKKDDKVKIFSEQKKDITSAFTTLVEDIKKLSDKDFYVDGELVPYDKNGKALGRRPLMKFIGAVESGKKVDDSNIKLHIWDIIYYDNKDLRSLPLIERKEYLKKLKLTDRITDTPYKLVKGKEELEKAIKWAEKLEGSEGAVVKEADSPYTFNEKSKAWLKYHRLVDIDCVVLERHETKAKNVYNYRIGIYLTEKEAKMIHPDRLLKFRNKYVLDLKNTFNTDEKFEPGDIISVAIEDIWRHETSEGIYYSLHKPKVRHITEKKNTSTLEELDNLVTSIGYAVIEKQAEADVDEEAPDTRSEIARKTWEKIWHTRYPKDGKGEWCYMCHWRGLTKEEAESLTHRGLLVQGIHSVHGDLRLLTNPEVRATALTGFTVFEGDPKDIPLETGSKLIYIAIHKKEKKIEKLQGAWKLPEPLDWLYVARKKPYISAPKGPGATSKSYAKFFTLDWGTFQQGIMRQHFFEYFIKGKKMKGRMIITYAPIGGKRVWLIDFPEDQTPYAEKYKLEDVIKELKKKKQKWLIWCKPGEKPIKIDVEKYKL